MLFHLIAIGVWLIAPQSPLFYVVCQQELLMLLKWWLYMYNIYNFRSIYDTPPTAENWSKYIISLRSQLKTAFQNFFAIIIAGGLCDLLF